MKLVLSLMLLSLFAGLDASANCKDPDRDVLGDFIPKRTWQRANTPTRCGPWQPWNVSLRCPSDYPDGQSCHGVPSGALCYGHSTGRMPGFWCDAPPGQSPDPYANAVFDIYVCP